MLRHLASAPRYDRCYDPTTATIAAAAITAGGSFMGQQSANSANRDIAAQNNATSIELADTQYQRTVADLHAAGLNPILAATLGGGPDPTPSLSAPIMSNPMAGFSNSASSIGDSLVKAAQIKNINADTTNKQAQTAIITSDAALKSALVPFASDIAQSTADTAYGTAKSSLSKGESDSAFSLPAAAARVQQLRLANQLQQLGMNSAAAASRAAQSDEWFYNSGFGKVMRFLHNTGSNLNPFGDAAKSGSSAVSTMIK